MPRVRRTSFYAVEFVSFSREDVMFSRRSPRGINDRCPDRLLLIIARRGTQRTMGSLYFCFLITLVRGRCSALIMRFVRAHRDVSFFVIYSDNAIILLKIGFSYCAPLSFSGSFDHFLLYLYFFIRYNKRVCHTKPCNLR